jgi:RNA polymerase sigma-70 factor (ECF subfamily)
VTDEELVEKVKKGDADVYEKIIQKYQSKVFGLIYNMTKNQNEIEDLAQEVFIKIYKNLGKFKGESSLYTWIYKITVNLCLDEMKKRKNVIYLDEKIEVDDGEVNRELPSEDKSQEELYEEKELQEKLHNCINKLPEKQRVMIVLRDIKGFSYEEISKITDVKLGTVKSQINRARLKLKELLDEEGTFLEYIESN